MERTKNRREHYNLYYIFLDDKKAHLLSVDKRNKIWEKIKKFFSS